MSTTRKILRAIERDRIDEAESATLTLAVTLDALRLFARRGTGSDSVLELRRTIAEIEVALSEMVGAS